MRAFHLERFLQNLVMFQNPEEQKGGRKMLGNNSKTGLE